MATTIKDIAKATGFSPATVSLVLNHKDHRIPQKTRDTVLQAAKELNYRPNRMAASLVTKKSRTIGLILPDITNSFFSEIAAAVEQECSGADYSVILCSTNDVPEQDVRYVNLLLERNVDGVLFAMAVNSQANCADECLALLQEAGAATVLLDREWKTDSTVNVTSNNEEGGYLACRHLLDLGHTRIGCITGPMGTQSAQKRLYGYIRALQEDGIAFDPALVLEGDYHTGSGYALTEKLLEQGVTAIFAANDMMAMGVYKKLRELKLKIPRDVSVVGYDNLTFAELMEVPLTTVSQPAREMGITASKKLLQMLEGNTEQSEVYTPRLEARASTAAPRKATGAEQEHKR